MGIRCVVWGKGNKREGESSKPKVVKGCDTCCANSTILLWEMLSEMGQVSNGLSIGVGWVAGQDGTGMGSLDAANCCNSSGLTEIFPPKPTFRVALLMKDMVGVQ